MNRPSMREFVVRRAPVWWVAFQTGVAGCTVQTVSAKVASPSTAVDAHGTDARPDYTSALVVERWIELEMSKLWVADEGHAVVSSDWIGVEVAFDTVTVGAVRANIATFHPDYHYATPQAVISEEFGADGKPTVIQWTDGWSVTGFEHEGASWLSFFVLRDIDSRKYVCHGRISYGQKEDAEKALRLCWTLRARGPRPTVVEMVSLGLETEVMQGVKASPSATGWRLESPDWSIDISEREAPVTTEAQLESDMGGHPIEKLRASSEDGELQATFQVRLPASHVSYYFVRYMSLGGRHYRCLGETPQRRASAMLGPEAVCARLRAAE